MFAEPENDQVKKLNKEHRKSRRHKRRSEKRKQYKNLHKQRQRKAPTGDEQDLQRLTMQTQNDLRDIVKSSTDENEKNMYKNYDHSHKPIGMRPTKNRIAKSILPTSEQVTLAYEAGARKARPGVAPSVTNRSKPPPPYDSNNGVGLQKKTLPKSKPKLSSQGADVLKLLEQASKLTEDSSSFLKKMNSPPKSPRTKQRELYEKQYEKAVEIERYGKSHRGGNSPTKSESKESTRTPPPKGGYEQKYNDDKKKSIENLINRSPPKHMTDEQTVFNIKSAALKGNAQAQYRMGLIFQYAKYGVKQDIHEAVRFYMLAAGSGHVKAQVNIGMLYEQGLGVEQSDAIAVRYYTRASDNGDAKALFNLGMCYKNGKGVAQNDEEAVRLFKESASKGNTNAKFVLGVIYAKGKRVQQDANEAISFYNAAAKEGDSKAMCNLGVLYEGGMPGVPRNDVLAVKFFQKAIENGDPNALGAMNLGQMCFQGRAGPKGKGPDDAMKYVKQAAENGNPKAQYDIGCMHETGTNIGIEQDFKEARRYFRLATKKHYGPAYFKLGQMYLNSDRGAVKNYKVASKHFKNGIELGGGDLDCMFHLGKILVEGSVEPPFKVDKVKGTEYIRRASTKGYEKATAYLRDMDVLPVH